MALRKMFSYKHHCDKYGNGHYDSNNGYQTFSTAPCETIDSCRHMSTPGFWWLFPWTFTFWMNTIDNDCLFLFGRHIFFSAINVGFTSFLSEILATYCALKLLKGMRKYLPRKSMPTWSDLDNLTPLTRSNLGQDPFQRHDFSLFFFLLIRRSNFIWFAITWYNPGFTEDGCAQMSDDVDSLVFGKVNFVCFMGSLLVVSSLWTNLGFKSL